MTPEHDGDGWGIEQGAIASAQTVIAPNDVTYFYCGERNSDGRPRLYKNHNMSSPTNDSIPVDILVELERRHASMMALPYGEREAEVKRRRAEDRQEAGK